MAEQSFVKVTQFLSRTRVVATVDQVFSPQAEKIKVFHTYGIVNNGRVLLGGIFCK